MRQISVMLIQSLFEVTATKYSLVNCTKIGGRSSAIRASSRLAGPPDNAQGRSSSCPGGFPGLEEDSYLKLRSGLLREFKSMSALFQRCQPAPEVGLRHVSADEQESTNWHDLIMLQDNLISTMISRRYPLTIVIR